MSTVSSVETYRTFTCSRCSVESVLKGTTDQPKGWIGVSFISPALASMGDARRFLLCTECEAAFADFMFR